MNAQNLKEVLKSEIARDKLRSNELNEMIGHLLQCNTLSEQKKLEICQVGKLLTLLEDEKAEVQAQYESPDFIISINNEQIGLEHELLPNMDRVKVTQSIKNLFKRAAHEFEIEYPDNKLLANIWLTDDCFSFKNSEKEDLIKQINQYIYSLIKNIEYRKPEFIDDVRIGRHSGVYFSFNPDINNIETLDSDILNQAILKKEKLIDKYRATSNLQKQWLLIVIGQLSPDSYRMGDITLETGDSGFDRIYVLEDFYDEIYRMK